jgi:hypothetical protein
MKKLFLASTAVLFLTVTHGQITFQKTYGGTNDDDGSFIQQTTDGGFIIAGSTSNFGAGGFDAYLIKTDSMGDTLWTKTYGGTYDDYVNAVQQTTDGGYIVAGFTYEFGAGSSDIYIIKTNANGNTLWTKTFGTTYYEEGYFAQQTLDGGYIIAGGSDLIKTDINGDTLWTKTFDNLCESVQQTTDGGYIITGTTGMTGGDFYLLKTDTGGNVLWKKAFGGSSSDFAHCVRQTMEGGYIISGQTTSFGAGGQDLYLIKTNNNGDTLWTKTYGGSGGEYDGHYINQTVDGGYIFPAYTGSFGFGGGDAYIVKTDMNGNILWTKSFGGTNSDYVMSAQSTTDGGYVMCGSTRSFGSGYKDIYLIKVDSNGNSGCNETNPNSISTSPPTMIISTTSTVTSGCITTNPATQTGSGGIVNTLCSTAGVNDLQNQYNKIIIYPNPFSTQTTLQTDNPFHNATLTVDNCFGQTVAQIKNINGQTVVFSRDNLASGLYFVRLTEENKTIAVDKLVITHK